MSRKRNLLIDEYPLLVLPSLAKAIGLNEAIALQQLHYWIENPKGGVELDGERWVYNTYEQWQEDNFPFWSIPTIQRVFTSLEKMGLVVSKQKRAFDRKKYYRVHHINLIRWNISDWEDATRQDDMIDDSKVTSSLTETTSETNPEKEYSVLLFEKIFEVLKPDLSFNAKTFLSAARPVSFKDNVLTFSVLNDTSRDWLESRMSAMIRNTFPGILGEDADVRFVVLEKTGE